MPHALCYPRPDPRITALHSRRRVVGRVGRDRRLQHESFPCGPRISGCLRADGSFALEPHLLVNGHAAVGIANPVIQRFIAGPGFQHRDPLQLPVQDQHAAEVIGIQIHFRITAHFTLSGKMQRSKRYFSVQPAVFPADDQPRIAGTSHDTPDTQPVILRAGCVLRRLIPHVRIGCRIIGKSLCEIALILGGFLILHGAAPGDAQAQRTILLRDHQPFQCPILVLKAQTAVILRGQRSFTVPHRQEHGFGMESAVCVVADDHFCHGSIPGHPVPPQCRTVRQPSRSSGLRSRHGCRRGGCRFGRLRIVIRRIGGVGKKAPAVLQVGQGNESGIILPFTVNPADFCLHLFRDFIVRGSRQCQHHIGPLVNWRLVINNTDAVLHRCRARHLLSSEFLHPQPVCVPYYICFCGKRPREGRCIDCFSILILIIPGKGSVCMDLQMTFPGSGP